MVNEQVICDHCGVRIIGEPKPVDVDGKVMQCHKRCAAEAEKTSKR